MQSILNLHKLKTALDKDNTAIYQLGDICLNNYIGHNFKIEYLNEINCIACGTKTNKSYFQGYCFMCMKRLPECDICIVKPELCHFAQGTCRDSAWGENNCMKTHIVYLANTGDIKVGITKLQNIPSRWIDQGASQAIPIFAVESRLISGLVEILIKEHISDKTNWRKMLQCEPDTSVDLFKLRNNILEEIKPGISNIRARYGENSVEPVEGRLQTIKYPVIQYPTSIKSFNLDKDFIIKGKLVGIKGQYLIFDTGVINIRKFSGYKCNIL
ncbi:DUF2797 domain-containing protein [Allofrancisella guangzhouensis]|uniref:DUF2797 domain-containing protein n=1 Tax=Allofrancisella guangzhouensis TaxID=594679 RepID=A0A0A8E9S7_9GAMM|nr:DUF2797 domain-containing protein [Allofrancisella guangzhouensis]AJC48921.1 hypothetical protein SD28_04380 [Allofrancisella guangzhouensis]MBK2027114.1 DUF2797 domain-containing protein [Allofrancisella guangzhouensis]MBK2043775.1 DUF2797 domain-containing protein [Allofrancisella guangzhouensis]MBK2045648.1 DUF2797 domain-containing protein [Allofrancisella guangzhouensis]